MATCIRSRLLFLALACCVLGGTANGVRAEEPPMRGGSLKGHVRFNGEPIPARKIRVTKDADHCGHAGGEFQEVRIGPDGGLADVIVELHVKGDAWAFDEPDGGYVLRQKGCQFTPWLLVVPNGANVKVFNDDEVTHNVNTGLWNEMQAPGAEAVEKPIKGRQGIRVSCNIHSWMEAWIYPARSPFYAHTKKDGVFEIANIPPGKYRATAWHPSLGREKFRVEIKEGESVTQKIEFESP